MMKLAIGAAFAALCVGVLADSVEAVIGLSGYLVAGGLLIMAVGAGARALFGSKSHAFDQRTTEGGFLN